MKMRKVRSAGRGGSSLHWRCGLLAGVVSCLTIVVLLTSACDSGASVPTAPAISARSTSPTATPDGFPAFGDWRAVYADADGDVHAVSLNGKQDVVGPALLALAHAPLNRPSVSPDGHWLATGCVPGVCILDLTGHHASLTYAGLPRGFSWSADSSILALDNGTDGEATIHVPDGAVRQISPVNGAYFDLIGWVDSTHLAGTYAPIPPTPTRPPSPTPISSGSSSGPQTATLAVQDITSGNVHIVFSLTSSSLGLGNFILAPDGKHALLYNVQWRDDPYTPDVRLIDMSTGAATKLPQVSQMMGQGGGCSSITWRDGTLMLAASTGVLENGDLKTWVLDAQHDVARALPYEDYVGGWAPDSDTLVLTTSYFSYGYAGPFTLTAVANASSGTGTPTTLTDDAYHLSFGGFARTAP